MPNDFISLAHNHSLTAKSKAVLLIIAAALVIYLAIRLFMSSLYTHQATLFLEDWQSKQILPSQQAWAVAKDAMLNAEAWSPVQDAFLQEKIGKVYEWNTYAEEYGSSKVVNDRYLALEAYREQVQITPLWPNAWLNVISIKIQLNEFDLEFSHALDSLQITANGYFKPLLQLSIITVQAWHGLSSIQKSQMIRVISTSASKSVENSVRLRNYLNGSQLLVMTCIYSRSVQMNTYKLCV